MMCSVFWDEWIYMNDKRLSNVPSYYIPIEINWKLTELEYIQAVNPPVAEFIVKTIHTLHQALLNHLLLILNSPKVLLKIICEFIY